MTENYDAGFASGTDTCIPTMPRKQEFDETKYTIIRGVPIFDEDDDYDEKDLDKIVANNNQRFQDTQDYCPIVIGHTDPSKPEIEQPPIVGWAMDFAIGEIGTVNPRKTVTATFCVDKQFEDQVKAFPRRSVELWPDDLTIDPIALLSGSRPRKNLGLLNTYAKINGRVRRYSYNILTVEGVDMDKEELVKLIMDTVKGSELGAYVAQKMGEPSIEDTKDAIEASIANPEAIVKPEETPEDKGEESQVKEEAVAEAKEEGEPVAEEVVEKEEEAGVEAPVPVDESPADEPKDDEEGDDEEEKKAKKGKYSALQYALAMAQSEVKKFQARVSELESEKTQAIREKELFLLNQQYSFALKEEIELTQDMSEADFARHTHVIKTRYAKAPVGVKKPDSVSLTEDGRTPSISNARVREIVQYALDHNVPYAEAKVKLGV